MVDSILSSLGGGSGIDTKKLVESLVEAERAPREFILDTKQATLETQISGYGALRSAMSGIQDSMQLLADADTFNARNVAFANTDLVTPTAVDAGAITGEYEIHVTSLAKAHSVSYAAQSDPDAALGAGTLTFSFGHLDGAGGFDATGSKASKTLTIDESNNTLNGIKDAINDADFGVQASIIETGDGQYTLQVTSESGANNEMKIDVGAGVTGELANFAFDGTGGGNFTERTEGGDAQFSVNGLDVTRTTNTLDDVIEGLEFTLSGVSADVNDTMTIGIEADKVYGEQIVRDFVEAYNLFLGQVSNLTTATELDEEAEDLTPGSLSRDPTTKTMVSQVRSMISSTITGLDGNYTALATVGIQTSLTGDLEINEDLFSDALENNYKALTDLFSGTSSSSDARLGIVKTTAATTPGNYEVVVTTDPAKGYLAGGGITATDASDISLDTATGVFAGGLDAGVGDYSFQISVDGTLSNSITLAGNYADVDALIADMEALINDDDSISGVGAGVDISYDSASESFTTTSRAWGKNSTVSFSNLSADMDRFAFGGGATSAGLTGTEVAGAIGVLETTGAIADTGVTDMGTQAVLAGGSIDESIADLSGTQAALNGSAITNGVSVGNFATATFDTATDLFSGAFDLSSDGAGASGGYTFDISVDGNSVSVDLVGTAYTSTADLVSDIQSQINTGLAATSSSVVVGYDAGLDQFTFTSDRQGTDSVLQVSNASASMAQLGIVNAGPVTGGADTESFVSALDTTGKDFSLNVTIDGNAIAVDLSNTGTYANTEDFRAALEGALTGATVSYDSVANSYSITSDSGGVTSSVEITAVGTDMAAVGFVAGPAVTGVDNETFVNPLDTTLATAGDYAMTVNVDGTDVVVDLATIDVGNGAGIYNTADEIQGALDTAVATAMPGAGVSYDTANNRYTVTSGSSGVSSTVDITALGAGMADLGFAVESGEDSFVPGLDTTGMSFTLTSDSGVDNIVLGATYDTPEALKDAIQGMITNSGVTVGYDADSNAFSFSGASSGASASVAVSAATGVGALGIANDSDTGRDALVSATGVDVVGTINGVEAFGSGDIMLPELGGPLAGLSLEVAPGFTSGTISIARGFGSEVSNILDTFLEANGLISTRETRLNDQVSDIDTDRETLGRQMDARFTMLQNQFLAMEAIIRSLNSVSGQLDGLVDRLPFTAKQ